MFSISRIISNKTSLNTFRIKYEIYAHELLSNPCGSLTAIQYDNSLKENHEWMILEFNSTLLELLKEQKIFVVLSTLLIKQNYVNKGFGQKLINELKKDFANVIIVLVAEPFDHETITRNELILWYEKFGFISINEKNLANNHYMACLA